MATATSAAANRNGKRKSLSDAITGSRKLPSRIVLHGQAGIGKTSFAAQAPKPFFLMSPGETGLHTLMDAGSIGEVPNIEVETWQDVMGIIEDLTTGKHGRETLIIDTLDGLEKLANQHVCDEKFDGEFGEKGFLNFHKGYRLVAQGPWKSFLASLDLLREKRNMHIIGLVHTGVASFKNPAGPDFDRYVPTMYKDAWELTQGWADAVLFAQREIVVKADRGKTKGKAAGGSVRTLYCEYDASHDAKNRLNLPPEIDMGTTAAEAWAKYNEAVENGRNQRESA